MKLQQELALRAAHVGEVELLQLMGYRHPSLKNRQRLKAVVADPILGLRSSAFDFRFSSDAFVKALADALGLDKEFVSLELDTIRQQIEADENRFIPRIWVETGFKRSTQPIFALAASEHQREIYLSPEELTQFDNASMPERVQMMSERVRQHYQEHSGRLGIWGFIQHYEAHLDPEVVLKLLPDGTVREEIELQEERARASLAYNGRPILTKAHEEGED